MRCASTQTLPGVSAHRASVAGVPGLEPRLTEPESVGLPITPYPIGARRTGDELYPSPTADPNRFPGFGAAAGSLRPEHAVGQHPETFDAHHHTIALGQRPHPRRLA